MATKKRSALEEEKMTDANILRVIGLLEPTEPGEKPITKKLACELLGMTYNTTRLGQVIEEYRERKAKEKARRAEKRGKPATSDEIVYIIQDYLEGQPIDSISRSIYRSPSFVKGILEKYHVPIRSAKHDYFKPELIPEGAVRERFKVGEIVYSARYDSTARIDAEIENSPKHGWVYRLWLIAEKWSQCCYQPASELASLEHLRELGVRV
jgi:hypothetical protein